MAGVDEGALAALRAALRSPDGVQLDGDQEAEVLAYMQTHSIAPDNPLVLSFVDLLRVKADIARTAADAVAQGVERGVATAIAASREGADERDATQAIIDVRTTLDAIKQRKTVTSYTVQPSAAAAIYVAVLALAVGIAGLLTWSLTRSYDAGRLAADVPRAAALLETPGGRAASKLLSTNGDALAVELSHCEHYLSGTKPALRCDVWADGATATSLLTPADRILDALLHFPAWPLVVAAIVIVFALAIFNLSQKKKVQLGS